MKDTILTKTSPPSIFVDEIKINREKFDEKLIISMFEVLLLTFSKIIRVG